MWLLSRAPDVADLSVVHVDGVSLGVVLDKGRLLLLDKGRLLLLQGQDDLQTVKATWSHFTRSYYDINAAVPTSLYCMR